MPFSNLSTSQWIDLGISALILAAALLLGRRLINFLTDRIIGRVTGSTRTTLDDALLGAVKPSLFWILLILALQNALSRLDFIDPIWSTNFTNFYFVVYVLIGFIASWRLIDNLVLWYTAEVMPHTESDLDEQLMPFLRRVALVLLAVIISIILLDYFGIEVSGLVTTLGIGSLAIALAAQAALSDTISGFIIMIDRPFRIGDRIELLDLDTWGDVIDIGLRSSRIRTRDNRMVVVPNSVIVKSLIVNHTFPDSQYRIETELGIAYGTDLEKARLIIVNAVRQVDGVLTDHPIDALFLKFGESALIFRVRWWLESYIDTRRMFDSVNSAIYNALNTEGIIIPIPQRELHHHIKSGDVDHITAAIRSK
ncbi:MAG: mechanosensitive ion channel [Anaerolineae bacterium]|nr:mechanosensitive ion channel [Anaerolineae bacterium]